MKQRFEYACLAIFVISVIGFALTSHREGWSWWRWGLLAATGIGLCGSWIVMDDPLKTIFGEKWTARMDWWVVVALGLAILAAACYRRLLFLNAFPTAIHWFALPAMAIGAMEEILWRGWLQGTLARMSGPWRAIFSAAASHTAYKVALFIFPPLEISRQSFASLAMVGCLTFGFGIVLGFLRLRQGSIAASIAFHILFDLLVYGQLATAPWWVL
jgi:membrane protease YdiL (CAAX protease family)